MDINHHNLGALILAGGLGQRMGCQNKGLVAFGQLNLIDPVLNVLKQHCDYVAISANQDVAQYQAKHVEVWADVAPWLGFGPLAGVCSCEAHFPEHVEYIQVVPCDSPFIDQQVIEKLSQQLQQSDTLAVYAQTATQIYPVIFQFKRTAIMHLKEYLHTSNKRSIRQWLQEVGAEAVNFPDDAVFINMNDLQTLNQHLPKGQKPCL